MGLFSFVSFQAFILVIDVFAKAFGMEVWHMDFGFTLTRAGEEEHRAADVMRIATRITKNFRQFVALLLEMATRLLIFVSRCVAGLDQETENEQWQSQIWQELTDIQAAQEGLLLYFAEPDAQSGLYYW